MAEKVAQRLPKRRETSLTDLQAQSKTICELTCVFDDDDDDGIDDSDDASDDNNDDDIDDSDDANDDAEDEAGEQEYL